MIFEDKYVQKGEAGGKEAAASLWNGINDYIHDKLPDMPADCRIVTRIYANMKGLADICCKSGIVDRAALVEEFYRGFTGSKILFDFVDVGHGKDRADEKINGPASYTAPPKKHKLMAFQSSSNYTSVTSIANIFSSDVLTTMAMPVCWSNIRRRRSLNR